MPCSVPTIIYCHIYVRNDVTGALSVTDSDDDYCVSYAVTMVDVRSCTRPPRSPDQLPTSVYIILYIHIISAETNINFYYSNIWSPKRTNIN